MVHNPNNWYHQHYQWESLCNGTCQPAFQCLYEAKDFEDAIKNCISIGGDCDTTAAICGSIAQALHPIRSDLNQKIRTFLDEDQKEIVDEFERKFGKWKKHDLARTQ